MILPTIIPSFDGFFLSCTLYQCEHPKAMVQIVHGVVEYKGRYDGFARYLADIGYCVLICDQRGHGESIDGHFVRGYMPDLEVLVEDQKAINQFLHELQPNLQVHMIAHSFGANIARSYLARYDYTISSLTMSGLPAYVPGIRFALAVVRMLIVALGKHGYGFISSKLTTSASLSWVCSDPVVVEMRRKDPYCKNFKYQLAAIHTIFNSIKALHEYSFLEKRNKLLPILCISGRDDPIPGGSKGLADTIASLKKCGYKNIDSLVFEGMRHEVLNEIGKEKVYGEIIIFMEGSIMQNT